MNNLLFAILISILFSFLARAQTNTPVSGVMVTNERGQGESAKPSPSPSPAVGEPAPSQRPASQEISTQQGKTTSETNQSLYPGFPPPPGDKGPRDGQYHAMLSMMDAQAGRIEQARANAAEAVRLLANPNDAAQFYARGVAHQELENYDLALPDFDKAIQLNPQRAMAYYNRALVYAAKKEIDRALVGLDRAIELDPKLVGAHLSRGKIYSAKVILLARLKTITNLSN